MVTFGEMVRQFSNFRQRAAVDEKDGRGDFAWGQYETPLASYQKEFARLMPSIVSHLKRRKRDKPTFAMDVMSAGKAIRDLAETGAITGGLSVTLNDWRSESTRIGDSKMGVDVLAGNILYGTVTRKIRDWIGEKSRNNPHFDLIMCNPGLGFVSFPSGPIGMGLVENIFWTGISLLDPNGGTMLAYIPTYVWGDRAKISEWVEAINKAGAGLRVEWTTPYDYENGQYILKAVREQSDKVNVF